MLFLFLLLILLGTAAGVWFQGLWSAAVTLVNLILAMVIACSFYEPAATAIEGLAAATKSYTYLLDFVMLWVLFGIAYGVLRAITDALSAKAVSFDLPVELGGRTLLAVACGWLMVCFVAFSLHMAPLNSTDPLGGFSSPSANSFGPLAPDRLWLGYMHTRTRPAGFGGNQFDPNADFPLRYRDRRTKYSADGTSMRF